MGKNTGMTDSGLAVVVLAAGAGTRMRSALPKVLHPIAGVPLIGHVLATVRELSAAHVVAVVRHERERIGGAISELLPDALLVDQDEIPGTGRAVELGVAALPPAFDGDVVVLSGDVPLLDAATVARLVEEHRRTGAAATVLSTIADDPTGYGRVLRGADGLVDRIVEQADGTADELAVTEINSGSYVFTVAGLRRQLPRLSNDNAQGEHYITDVVALLRAEGSPVAAMPTEAWLVEGVNDRVQLGQAASRLNAMIVRGWQLAGVTVQDPATTWIDRQAVLAPDVELLPGTHLAGATTVARGARIGPETTLRDCEVGEDAVVIRTDANLAIIGARATVGPFAYLRPNARLGDGSKVGTFVEVKNSELGAGAKVPHLSYIGDAVIGTGTNIGAGTITANYDGREKHRTTVGEHARTGSNVVFVAPVEVGDGAYVGAGTTVRSAVEPGALAITEGRQRNIPGWVGEHRPGSAAAEAAEAAGAAEAGSDAGPSAE